MVALRSPSPLGADEEKPKPGVASSYDQIAPVLLGKESFQAVMARDKADKDSVMARQKKVSGGALRPGTASR